MFGETMLVIVGGMLFGMGLTAIATILWNGWQRRRGGR